MMAVRGGAADPRRRGDREAPSDDFAHGTKVTDKVLADLGFDVERWRAVAGMPSNEPPEPTASSKRRRPTKRAAVQLTFAF